MQIKKYSILTPCSYHNGLKTYGFYNNLMPFDDRLCVLHLALEPAEDIEVNVLELLDKNKAAIRTFEIFKDQAKIDFRTLEEEREFNDAYDEYYDKRWKEMPRVDLSLPDYYELLEKWKKIEEERPNVKVFTLDDSGPLDKVDIFGKDELSQEDIDYIKADHERYLQRENALQCYNDDHPSQKDDKWYGPQDSFFEADLQKYYGRDGGFLPIKIYTRELVGQELKEMVARKEYPEIIGRWANILFGTMIEDGDDGLEELLKNLALMSDSSYFRMPYKDLDDIADKIIAGEQINFDWDDYEES